MICSARNELTPQSRETRNSVARILLVSCSVVRIVPQGPFAVGDEERQVQPGLQDHAEDAEVPNVFWCRQNATIAPGDSGCHDSAIGD